jgi:hypothetical protein
MLCSLDVQLAQHAAARRRVGRDQVLQVERGDQPGLLIVGGVQPGQQIGYGGFHRRPLGGIDQVRQLSLEPGQGQPLVVGRVGVDGHGFLLKQRFNLGNQKRQIGLRKAQARRWNAVTFDIRRNMLVMRNKQRHA